MAVPQNGSIEVGLSNDADRYEDENDAEQTGDDPKLINENDACVNCHMDLWEKALQNTYIHKPFLEKQCKYCHIKNFNSIDDVAAFMADKKVTWLSTRKINTNTHWFKLPLDAVKELLLIDFLVGGEGSIRKELPVPPLDQIVEVENDETPPIISNVRVVHIEQGLFLDVTVAWDTDELATSQIAYGLKDITLSSGTSDNMTKNHEIVLSGLKPKKKYKFKVSSADIFNNEAVSKLYAFSTQKAKMRKRQEKSEQKKRVKLEMDHQFYRTSDHLMVQLNANQPVLVAVGVPKEGSEEEKQIAMVTTGPAPEEHDLKNSLETNNTICEPCHGVYVEGSNHPVNVPPKEGMRIPDEYFVLSNGNITCMSCHAAHSSNIEYRLVRSSKKELCVGCHIAKLD